MYLFRAVNAKDVETIEGKKPLTALCCQSSAYTEDGKGYLQTVADHIMNGSSPQHQHCWISLAQDFNCCANEYSVPQTGEYNTANKRKRIAVFDVSGWGSEVQERNFGDSCTFFLNKEGKPIVDFLDLPKFQEIPRRYKRKRLEAQIAWFIGAISQTPADTGLLDCGNPTKSVRRTVGALNQLSLLEMSQESHYGIILSGNKKMRPGVKVKTVNIISTGPAKASLETLALNYIPVKAFKKLLSFLEIDFLAAVGKSNFDGALDDIISAKLTLSLSQNRKEIMVNGKALSFQFNAADYFGEKTCVDIAIERFRASRNCPNIEQLYQDALQEKRSVMQGVLQAVNPSSNAAQNPISILEDNANLWVKKVEKVEKEDKLRSFKNKLRNYGSSARKYDLIAVQCGDKLYVGYDIWES